MRAFRQFLFPVTQTFAFTLVAVCPSIYSAPVATHFQRPLASISRISNSVGAYDSGYCGNHLGQDLPQPAGTAVFAIADGDVKYSNNLKGLGHAVHVEHILPDLTKVVSVYYHLKRLGSGGLALGSTVTRGQTIGYISDLAADYGTGPHLHFGIRMGAYLTGTDSRTNKWYYPGYSSLFQSDGETRICSPSDAKHAQITSE